MKTLMVAFSAILFLFAGTTRGVSIEPDSVAREVTPWSDYHLPLDTLTFTNQSDEEVTIDSITIRLLDGDSVDFNACSECEPGEYGEYLYGGWSYGQSDTTLRYVRDSLFLLQDGEGLPVTFLVPANGTAEFTLYLFVNCPVCGRMPSIPATVDYRYMFHLSTGETDTVMLTVQNSTTLQNRPVRYSAPIKVGDGKTGVVTIGGRKISQNKLRYQGVVLGVGGKKIEVGGCRSAGKK